MEHLFQKAIWYEKMVDITRGSHDHTNQIGTLHKHPTKLESGSKL